MHRPAAYAAGSSNNHGVRSRRKVSVYIVQFILRSIDNQSCIDGMVLKKLLNKFHSESGQTTEPAPYLIVGLGNPGRQYHENRHNTGFMVIDRLADRLGVSFTRLESKALLTKADHQGQRLVLAKPQTFMNLSGQPVGALRRFYKIPMKRLLVVYDDVDLPFGTIRLRPDGGSGGQKGMASIIQRLGTQEFPRLRMGIGRPPGRMDAAAYVLQDFTRQEKEMLNVPLERAVDAVLTFVEYGLDAAMNQYNGAVEDAQARDHGA
jgi:PTH1 family peptidyl-tRNA hydrolase